jgi:hypothetical protein
MNTYQPRHARHADPAELSVYMRGLADLIQIVPSENDSSK